MPEDLSELANTLLDRARAAKLTVITAESCTAGLLCQVLSDTEGAARHFHGGFVTYTKAQKNRALGVRADVLRDEGAVCAAVAHAMVEGALRHSSADIGAAITGVAGPEPDEDGNPVGFVCIAVGRRGFPPRDLARNYGDIGRDAIRKRAVADALREMARVASLSAAA